MSKTRHPRILVLKQCYNSEDFSPSDLDLRLVSIALPTSVGEEPCEIVVLPHQQCLGDSLSQPICFYRLLPSGSQGRCPHSLVIKGVDCLSVLPSFYRAEKLINDTGIYIICLHECAHARGCVCAYVILLVSPIF